MKALLVNQCLANALKDESGESSNSDTKMIEKHTKMGVEVVCIQDG